MSGPRPDRLSKFLDRPHVVTAASSLPLAFKAQMSNGGFLSGLTVNEQTVARTKTTDGTRSMERKPVVLTDKRAADPMVMTLTPANLLADMADDSRPLSFSQRMQDSQNQHGFSQSSSGLTATDIWKKRLVVDFGSEDALEEVLNQSAQGRLTKAPSGFRNCSVQASGVAVVPAASGDASASRAFLQTPSMRRRELEAEVGGREARHAIGRAFAEKKRLETLLRVQHPRGVLGTAEQHPEEALDESLRRKPLVKTGPFSPSSSSAARVNPLQLDAVDADTAIRAGLATTRGKRSVPGAVLRRNVLLEGGGLRPQSQGRLERLAWNDTRGRDYDILTGRQKGASP